MTAPLHLSTTSRVGPFFGRLFYNAGSDTYSVRDGSLFQDIFARIFSEASRNDSTLSVPRSVRSVATLNWIMLRYPLDIFDPVIWDLHLAECRRATSGTEPVSDASDVNTYARHPHLLPFQISGVCFLIRHPRCLLADAQGLGKSVQALAAIEVEFAFPALVVCQAYLIEQWTAVIDRWLPSARCRTDPAWRPLHGDTEKVVHIVSYGCLDKVEGLIGNGFNYAAVVLDEVQDLRHAGSVKYSAAIRLSAASRRCWGLSGTPIFGYGAEIRNVMDVIEPGCLGGIDNFSKRWCLPTSPGILADPHALHQYLVSEGLMLRRRIEDVGHRLPGGDRLFIKVPIDTDLYHQDSKKTYSWDKDRLKTGLAKAAAVCEFVVGQLDRGGKVVLFAHHHEVFDAYADRLRSFNPVSVTGRESVSERASAVETFSSGRSPLLLMSMRTAAGVDGLQKTGTVVVFGELDWSPAVHAQCHARLRRIGSKNTDVPAFYLYANTPSDGVMMSALDLKESQSDGLLGDVFKAPLRAGVK